MPAFKIMHLPETPGSFFKYTNLRGFLHLKFNLKFEIKLPLFSLTQDTFV